MVLLKNNDVLVVFNQKSLIMYKKNYFKYIKKQIMHHYYHI